MNGKRAFTQTWSNSIGIVSAGVTGSSGLLSTIYPQATMINRDSTTSPVLSYGNVYVRDYDDVTRLYTSYQTGIGLYEKYYRNSIEMLKSNPRIRSAYVNLKNFRYYKFRFYKINLYRWCLLEDRQGFRLYA